MLLHNVHVLNQRHAYKHDRLENARAELPRSHSVSKKAAALAGDVGSGEEASKTGGCVRHGWSIVARLSEKDSDTEKNGVAGLSGM